MQDRQKLILKAIIQEFIETAKPIGSKTILLGYNFDVSPATIRSDMASLEKEGLIQQPHTSAGRIPTDLGYRIFVDELAEFDTMRAQAKKTIKTLRESFAKNKVKKKVYEAVSILSHATNNVCFATLPESRTFYLGISNVLKKPEFINNPLQASQVVEVIEDSDNFINTIAKSVEDSDQLQIFIGQENILTEIQSCSMIIGRYQNDDFSGYIGILGPTRMNYAYNSVILEEVLNLLNEEINE
jgi:transcriptional regulator of heat shock response